MPHHMTPQVIEKYRAHLLENEKSPATIEKYLRDIRCLYSFLAQGGAGIQEEKEFQADRGPQKDKAAQEGKAVQENEDAQRGKKALKAVTPARAVVNNPQTKPPLATPLQAATPAEAAAAKAPADSAAPSKVTVGKPALLAWREMLGQTRAPGTVNGMLSAVNGLFKFLGWRDCLVRFLKVQRRLFRSQRRQLSQAEYHRLLAAAEQKGDRRLQLLLETMCATGIRVSEVPYITLQAARQGSAQITLKGKIRTILLPGKLCRKLRQYAQAQGITGGPLFVTRNGNPLPRRQIWAQMKGLCRAARVEPSKVFPHNLRHLFATAFYHACRDIARLADVLGHSSIETTRIYLVTTGEEQAKQLDKLGLVT